MNKDELERFWADNSIAEQDPLGKTIPQAALGVAMSYETVFSELGYQYDIKRLETDYEFARSVARRYNDLAQEIVGRRLLDEEAYDPSLRFPHVKEVGELFGCKRIWNDTSWWMTESAQTENELRTLLNRLSKWKEQDVHDAMFPDNWDESCKRIYQQHGLRPHLPMDLRGPVTLATSVMGTENFLFMVMDNPQLAAYFRDVMIHILGMYYRICQRLNGDEYPCPGFVFRDDNCTMMTPDMYELFGLPILKAVFDEFACKPGQMRYQHSDSDMEHLLPLLAEAKLTRVNFGPNVRFASIRAIMPHAIVEGTLAPFTFMRNDEAQIIKEVRRDLDQARETRGLVVATAGSINDGSKLSSMLAIMNTIKEYGRYNN